MSEPWLSVIIPTYNGAAFLSAALDSIASQAHQGLEIIAVDDGSTDSTSAVLESYRTRLPLRCIQCEHSGNWVANTNLGLTTARGTWVSLLHQDDVWLPNRLNVLRSVEQRFPGAALVAHPTKLIDTKGKHLGTWRCPFPARIAAHDPSKVKERLLVQNFIALPAPLFRRQLAQKVGGLAEDLWYTADWDLWLKLAGEGPTVYVPQALSGFRIHPASQTIQRTSGLAEMRRQYEIVLERHLQQTPRRVRDVAHFGAELNLSLAATMHGGKADWRRLSSAFAALGPAGWRRFLRDSRITERVAARLRARLFR